MFLILFEVLQYESPVYTLFRDSATQMYNYRTILDKHVHYTTPIVSEIWLGDDDECKAPLLKQFLVYIILTETYIIDDGSNLG